MGKFIDLTGKRFGRLTVLGRAENENGKVLWNCICDCGNTKVHTSGRLNSGVIASCGCLLRERTIERNTKHGKSRTRLYSTWREMKRRCYNEKRVKYKDYGARGIIVCDEWKNDFMNFYNWAMANGYADNLSIDRIDNDGNYEPSNCRWATDEQQMRNQRKTIHFTLFGIEKTLSEWCEYADIKYGRAYQRLNNGNPPFDENELERIKTNLEHGGNKK